MTALAGASSMEVIQATLPSFLAASRTACGRASSCSRVATLGATEALGSAAGAAVVLEAAPAAGLPGAELGAGEPGGVAPPQAASRMSAPAPEARLRNCLRV